jgi:hypothetical protein
MTILKKTVVLALTCALLLWAMPGASLAAEDDLAGTWENSIDAPNWKLILNTDGAYFSISSTDEGRYGITGSWSAEDGRLHFTPGNGLETALDYRLDGDALIFADFRTGKNITLFRMHPMGPSVPPEIVGSWTGEDWGVKVYVTLDATGRITVVYEASGMPALQGNFVVKNDALDIMFTDGSRIELKYSLAEESRLILADEKTGAMLTLARSDFGRPSVFPAPGGKFQWDDWGSTPAPGLYLDPRPIPGSEIPQDEPVWIEPFATVAPTPPAGSFDAGEWTIGPDVQATVPPAIENIPFGTYLPAGATPRP